MSILCYHAVQRGWSSPMAVTPEAFGAQLDWLSRHRKVLPLAAVTSLLDRRGRPPRGTVALTFDDGLSSLYDHALPALRRHSMPATVFLVAETLTAQGRPVDWVRNPPVDPPLTTLTTEQVLEMQEVGVDFQSHSWAHRDLPGLADAELDRDLRESRLLLEQLLGRPVLALAYPRGRHDERVRAAARRAGYAYAYALPERPEPSGPYSVPRVGVHLGNGPGAFRLKTQPAYVTARTSRAYAAVRRLRDSRTG